MLFKIEFNIAFSLIWRTGRPGSVAREPTQRDWLMDNKLPALPEDVAGLKFSE